NMVIAYRNGAAVRLTDVAEVLDSVENVRNVGLANGEAAVLVILYRQPGANIIETVDRVTALIPALKASIPTDIDIKVAMDRTVTIRSSLNAVKVTLAIAVGLVILVVFLFLQLARHAGTGGGGADLAARHLRRHVPARLQPRQPVAHGAHHRHRLRRRRRDRGAGEHHPPHRGGHAALPGGDHRLARGRLHGTVHEPVAGGGVHPHPHDGRGGRTAVPRVLHHALGGSAGVAAGIAHHHADDVLAPHPLQK